MDKNLMSTKWTTIYQSFSEKNIKFLFAISFTTSLWT